MPEPIFTSWAMEELLEPWVHVPINVHDSNTGAGTAIYVEEKMHRVIDNDDKARHISRAGKLWISDLVLHPDAKSDEGAIFDDILRRYGAHFVGL
jgi:hypothetical protein